MTSSSENFEPPIAPVLGSILSVVAWLIFILLYALYLSPNFSLFQNVIVTVASLLIASLGIGALWLVWYQVSGRPRKWWNVMSQKNVRERKRGDEFLSWGQRSGEVISALIGLAIFAFFAYHQMMNTGFFTSSFGPWEMFAFYGSILFSLVPALARAAVGRRNPVRPYEAAINLFFAAAALYLLGVFPFSFAHFSDALPVALRFVASWVSNDIAKVALVLMFVGSLISAGVNLVRYFNHTEFDFGDSQKHREQPIVG